MFRSLPSIVRKVGSLNPINKRQFGVSSAMKLYREESEEDLIRRYKDYFNQECIDHWEFRQGMNDLAQQDGVPDPEIIIAALKAARRLNDYALTIRTLEMVYFKCGNKKKKIWPYIVGEIQGTLDELGIETPQDLGFDKPQLWCKGTDGFYE